VVDDEFSLSAEFIRRLGAVDWKVVLPHDRNFKRQQKRCPPETEFFGTARAVPSEEILSGSAGALPSRRFAD